MSMPRIDTFESVKQVVPDSEITGSNAEETVVTRFANKSSSNLGIVVGETLVFAATNFTELR